jgi:lysozyme
MVWISPFQSLPLRCVLAWLVYFVWLPQLTAQQYAIDWWAVSSGGGVIGDGTNQIVGTIGQWNTAVMSGGPFQIESGFWPGPEAVTVTDLKADGLVWDGTVGLIGSYSVEGGPLASPTTAKLYWASGTNITDKLTDTAFFTNDIPADDPGNTFGPFLSQMINEPPNATYILMVLDPDNLIAETNENNNVLAIQNLQFGLDVSSVRGTVDWQKVGSDGRIFAFVKATEGATFSDTNFAKNITNAHMNGLLVGAYHFARLLNNPGTNGALLEASNFLSVARNCVMKGYLPPALDIEDDPKLHINLTTNPGPSALSVWIRTWCLAISNQTGIKPMLYMPKNYAQNGIEADLSAYPLWIATLGNSPDKPGANLGPWVSSWTFHQYDDNGQVDGVNNGAPPVDVDAFIGSSAELGSFVIGGPPPPLFTGVDGGSLKPPSNGQFEFQVSSPFIEQLNLQASEDLNTWFDVGTLDLVNGHAVFSDTNADSHIKMFYRVVP